MIYIYQFGRLERNFYENVRFKINSYETEYPLSSLALGEYFKEIDKKEVKNIILYPISLFLNFEVLNNDSKLTQVHRESLYNLLNSKYMDYKKLSIFFEDLTKEYYSSEAQHIILYSLGNYKYEENELHFDTTLDDLSLQIFVEMYNTISTDQDIELYLDISSGLNLYIAALIEAAKNFWTFFNLQNWGKKKISIFFVFSEPIRKNSIHNVYYNNEIKYRYFFECPIEKNSIDSICNYIDEVLFSNYSIQSKERTTQKEELKQILEELILTYNALKYNIPLFFLTFQLPEPEKLRKIVNQIIGNLYSLMYNRNLKSSPKLDRNKIMRVILSLAFFIGVKSIIDETIIHNQQIDNQNLKAYFEKIYNTLGLNLNKIYLSSELSIIQSKIVKILREINDEELKENLLNVTIDYFTLESIDNIIKLEENVKEKVKQVIENGVKEFDPKVFYSRNFFAHAGFEKNATLIKIIKESLNRGNKNVRFILSYKKEAIDKIKEELYKL
ncbi:MAG: hypothetical protein RMJ36_06750 [Candidatus Calescibacterium sp.]|nr:hypothetical protein [Candidatus Calescibacterium sp.]MDW8133334.1 hypothetical protein [Candidatus Calescibacterium sp.]